MTKVVREAINAIIGQVTAEAMIDLHDVMEAVFVGNPIMHHLLLGIDPIELGGAPFALATNSSKTMWASELDLDMHPDARVYVLPCIAGHVGADAAAVVLSEGPHLQDENWLVVDVGTNAEIVLGSRDRLLACSSPTGPAFEGAQISCGQRAAPGAIERLRIDRETLQPRFKVIGSDLWSDEPGFDEVVERTGVTGICGSGIIEALAEMFLSGIVNQDGVIDGAMAEKCPLVQPDGRTFSYLIWDGEPVIRVSQNDVRQIQLAKGALYAGAKLLMDQMGVESVDRITLAGAFGSHIDVKYAMVLGMIPDCDLAKVASAGNAASTGARIALLNNKARREIERVVREIEKIETAVEPKFQEHFVGAMGFPHATAPFPMLAREVDLPAPKKPTAARRKAKAAADAAAARRLRAASNTPVIPAKAGIQNPLWCTVTLTVVTGFRLTALARGVRNGVEVETLLADLLCQPNLPEVSHAGRLRVIGVAEDADELDARRVLALRCLAVDLQKVDPFLEPFADILMSAIRHIMRKGADIFVVAGTEELVGPDDLNRMIRSVTGFEPQEQAGRVVVTFDGAFVERAFYRLFDQPGPGEFGVGAEIDVGEPTEDRAAAVGRALQRRHIILDRKADGHCRTGQERAVPPARRRGVERDRLREVHHGEFCRAIGDERVDRPVEPPAIAEHAAGDDRQQKRQWRSGRRRSFGPSGQDLPEDSKLCEKARR